MRARPGLRNCRLTFQGSATSSKIRGINRKRPSQCMPESIQPFSNSWKSADGLTGEILDGQLYTQPRPTGPPALAAAVLGAELFGPFHRGRGGPADGGSRRAGTPLTPRHRGGCPRPRGLAARANALHPSRTSIRNRPRFGPRDPVQVHRGQRPRDQDADLRAIRRPLRMASRSPDQDYRGICPGPDQWRDIGRFSATLRSASHRSTRWPSTCSYIDRRERVMSGSGKRAARGVEPTTNCRAMLGLAAALPNLRGLNGRCSSRSLNCVTWSSSRKARQLRRL